GSYDRRRLPEERYRRLLFEWGHPKLAARCREKGLAYPGLGPDGEPLERPSR
ncbi:MAG: tRNA (guanine-N2)-dimethyltransferase, partial [Thermoanaerobaculia bacterium]|nr:tRNA (guanine-N2)-dimethyltransferase [Thermoanaerobaculia bacterium]